MIRGVVIGGEAVAARFERAAAEAMPMLAQRMQRVTVKLQAKVVRDKLSGGVLNVRTNNLRSSIHQGVTVSGDKVTGIVGTNVEYAAFHEYGFSGTQNVKEHLRKIKVAFGKPLKKPKLVSVRAHERKVEYPEKSFLRSAMEDLRSEIMVELTAAVKEVLQ